MTKQEKMAAKFKLRIEQDMRCGDGKGGKITTHSVICRCAEIERKLKILSS